MFQCLWSGRSKVFIFGQANRYKILHLSRYLSFLCWCHDKRRLFHFFFKISYDPIFFNYDFFWKFIFCVKFIFFTWIFINNKVFTFYILCLVNLLIIIIYNILLNLNFIWIFLWLIFDYNIFLNKALILFIFAKEHHIIFTHFYEWIKYILIIFFFKHFSFTFQSQYFL